MGKEQAVAREAGCGECGGRRGVRLGRGASRYEYLTEGNYLGAC